jgi:hypothetical protein
MRLLFTCLALACLACLAPAAETVVTTKGESFTKAADGKFYPSQYVAPNGTVLSAQTAPGCSCGDACPCPSGVCPQCPANVPTPMPRPGFLPDACPDGKCPMPLPGSVIRPAQPSCPDGKCGLAPTAGGALAEVNAKRAARGLRPFVEDPALTEAAQKCAEFRARYRLFGHVMTGGGDFSFLPYGARAASSGCAAYAPSYGWMSCCVYENYTYGGAAWAMGSDGKRYMHLFVR